MVLGQKIEIVIQKRKQRIFLAGGMNNKKILKYEMIVEYKVPWQKMRNEQDRKTSHFKGVFFLEGGDDNMFVRNH